MTRTKGGRGRTSEGHQKLPPSHRADCLATTNQPNIFGRVLQPIESVKAGFSALFLLVAERKNNVFLSTPHFSDSGEADNAKSRFEGDNLGFDGAERHMAHYC